MAADFARWKLNRLQGVDFSKKGSVDEQIKELINYINGLDQYFTTSSCSGRVIMFVEGECRKVGCKWVFVSHSKIEHDSLISAADASQGKLVVKFEPFILHVQCRNVSNAQIMHQAAVESGFRNSGLTLGKSGKIMVAIRGSHSLEVPIASDNQLVVEAQYLQFLATMVNKKFEENEKKIERFFENLKKYLSSHEGSTCDAKTCQSSVRLPRKTRRKRGTNDQLAELRQHSSTSKEKESSTNSEDVFENFTSSLFL